MKSKGSSFSKSVDRSYKNKVRILIFQAYRNFSSLARIQFELVPYNLSCVTSISIKKLVDFREGVQYPSAVELLKILDACRMRVNFSCPEPKEPLNYVPSSLISTI